MTIVLIIIINVLYFLILVHFYDYLKLVLNHNSYTTIYKIMVADHFLSIYN